MKSTLTRNICRLLVVLMAWMPYHVAQAGMIGTDQAVASAAQSERAALLSLVNRSDVASQLQALGVDAAAAKDRVAAMTDEEVRALSGQINALPAGADSGGVLLLVIIVLLVWWAWKR
jgi:shikimate 5-dehydrogenase